MQPHWAEPHQRPRTAPAHGATGAQEFAAYAGGPGLRSTMPPALTLRQPFDSVPFQREPATQQLLSQLRRYAAPQAAAAQQQPQHPTWDAAVTRQQQPQPDRHPAAAPAQHALQQLGPREAPELADRAPQLRRPASAEQPAASRPTSRLGRYAAVDLDQQPALQADWHAAVAAAAQPPTAQGLHASVGPECLQRGRAEVRLPPPPHALVPHTAVLPEGRTAAAVEQRGGGLRLPPPPHALPGAEAPPSHALPGADAPPQQCALAAHQQRMAALLRYFQARQKHLDPAAAEPAASQGRPAWSAPDAPPSQPGMSVGLAGEEPLQAPFAGSLSDYAMLIDRTLSQPQQQEPQQAPPPPRQEQQAQQQPAAGPLWQDGQPPRRQQRVEQQHTQRWQQEAEQEQQRRQHQRGPERAGGHAACPSSGAAEYSGGHSAAGASSDSHSAPLPPLPPLQRVRMQLPPGLPSSLLDVLSPRGSCSPTVSCSATAVQQQAQQQAQQAAQGDLHSVPNWGRLAPQAIDPEPEQDNDPSLPSTQTRAEVPAQGESQRSKSKPRKKRTAEESMERRRLQARNVRSRKRQREAALKAENERLRDQAARLQYTLYLWASQGYITPEQANEFLREAPQARG